LGGGYFWGGLLLGAVRLSVGGYFRGGAVIFEIPWFRMCVVHGHSNELMLPKLTKMNQDNSFFLTIYKTFILSYTMYLYYCKAFDLPVSSDLIDTHMHTWLG
jgi:hypothetical protein